MRKIFKMLPRLPVQTKHRRSGDLKMTFNEFMRGLTKNGSAVLGVHMQWTLKDGKARCPVGGTVDLHDPDFSLPTLEALFNRCTKNASCDGCPLYRYRRNGVRLGISR